MRCVKRAAWPENMPAVSAISEAAKAVRGATAARIEPVDFVIVSFGLAVSPIEEGRKAIDFDMRRAGFDQDVRRKARSVADATAIIIQSNFTEGFDQLEALKQQYGKEPWFRFLRGNFTSLLISTPEAEARKTFPALIEGVRSIRPDVGAAEPCCAAALDPRRPRPRRAAL